MRTALGVALILCATTSCSAPLVAAEHVGVAPAGPLLPASQVDTNGLPDYDASVAGVKPAGGGVDVYVSQGGCGDLFAQVFEEGEERVVIELELQKPGPGMGCAAVVKELVFKLALEKPIGSRTVVVR